MSASLIGVALGLWLVAGRRGVGSRGFWHPDDVELVVDVASGAIVGVDAADDTWAEVVGCRFNDVLVGSAGVVLPSQPGLVTAGLLELGVVVAGQERTLEAVCRRDRRLLSVTGRDVTDDRRTRRELIDRAATDPLTGLANRSVLDLGVETASARASRSRSLVALAVIDIDHLKAINDNHGHCAGDAAIVAAGQALKRAMRGGDTLIRFGGDEFVLVAAELLSAAEADTIAGRLVAAVAASDASVTVSVGIAVSSPRDAGGLLDAADTAMYRSKSRGGDCHHLVEVTADRNEASRRYPTGS